MSITVFLLTLGLVARVTRFITDDVLAAPIRTLVIRWFGDESKLYVLSTCPWCLSIWTAGALVPVAWFYGDHPGYLIPAIIGTISWVYAILASWLDGSKLVISEDD